MAEQLALEFEMTIEERGILAAIDKGRMRARSAGDLARLTNVPERRLRQVIRHLIDYHHCVIGSATDEPPGFYVITDPGELADVLGTLRHRGISILVRAARISGNSLDEIFKQGRLELEAEATR